MELSLYDLDALSQEEYAAGYAMLSEAKRRRVDRMGAELGRQRSVAVDLLARRMLARALNCRPEELTIETTENGKPYVPGCALHFSLAHTKRLAVCALDTRPIGVDVETCRPLSPALLRRFFAPGEAQYAGSDPSGAHAIYLWTRKEAYTKLRGGTIWQEGRIDLSPREGVLPPVADGCLFENRTLVGGYILGLCRAFDAPPEPDTNGG